MQKYHLPDPLILLSNPPTKQELKCLVVSKVTEFWHSKLFSEASQKSSLQFLKCQFLPLKHRTHPIWRSCRGSRTAIRSAIIQAKMLSGRYRTDYLTAKWTTDSGACLLPGCNESKSDLLHLLSGYCQPLRATLIQAVTRGISFLSAYPHLLCCLTDALQSNDKTSWVGLLLDPSTAPEVIKLRQMR